MPVHQDSSSSRPDHRAASRRHGLVSESIDRLSLRRADAEWIARQRSDPVTRFVPVLDGKLYIVRNTGEQPGYVSADDLAGFADLSHTILLGRTPDAGTIYFALPVDSGQSPLALDLGSRGRFMDLRRIAPLLPETDAALLAYARAMCHWHSRHRFCGVCGAATRVENAGHLRVCTVCETAQFPRTDPAIIVLVHDGGCCLLGRRPEWEPRRYSNIAGFVEPGETAEQAVAREVYEETGIIVGPVTYRSSQPWPFPGSLMLGFHAEAKTTEIRRLDQELADVRWFTREEIRGAITGGGDIVLPPGISISRSLIEDWAAS